MVEAARPKFAIVREDALVELDLIERRGAQSALLVASGGCTALELLARRPALRVAAFDLAPAQVTQMERKREAAARGDRAALNVDTDDPAGLNQRGEFEGLFRLLRAYVEEFVAPRAELEAFFVDANAGARADACARWFASRYWPAAFACAFNDPFLHAMFGPAATQHAERGSYPGYFRAAFERGLRRDDAHRNPFLQHVLLGRFLLRDEPSYVGANVAPVAAHLASLPDVPDLASYEVVSVSNVFDWSDDALVAQWARALGERGHPKCAVLIRQLNNKRDVRPHFSRWFDFDDALGAAYLARDRSLFYERFEVALRRPAP